MTTFVTNRLAGVIGFCRRCGYPPAAIASICNVSRETVEAVLAGEAQIDPHGVRYRQETPELIRHQQFLEPSQGGA